MTRIGYTADIIPDGSQFANMLAFVGSLTTWSIKGSWTLNPATANERNYIVLEHSTGAEVLIYVPNGSSSRISTGIWSGRRSIYVGDNTRPLSFSYWPYSTGGYTASGDPNLSAWWTPVGTASNAMSIESWWSGQGTHHCYMIEDDTEAFFCFYSNKDAQTWFGLWMVGASMLVKDPSLDPAWRTDGLFYVNPKSGVGPVHWDHTVWWAWKGSPFWTGVGGHIDVSSHNNLRDITNNSLQPGPGTKYLTSSVPARHWGANSTNMGKISQNYLRFAPRITGTYKTVRGNDQVNMPWTHLYRDYWTPWAAGLTFL